MESEFFEAPARDEEALNLTLDGWEGPLDLLLTLARGQKVDLHQISILALVEQYLAYLEGARKLRLEIAADYLVMAAWLARILAPRNWHCACSCDCSGSTPCATPAPD